MEYKSVLLNRITEIMKRDCSLEDLYKIFHINEESNMTKEEIIFSMNEMLIKNNASEEFLTRLLDVLEEPDVSIN